MAICETCDYANRPPYKSPCSECDKTMGSPFCCYEHEEKPTNADRIRAMSDEELAGLLAHETYRIAKPVFDMCGYGIIEEFIFVQRLKWLKQPAEE